MRAYLILLPFLLACGSDSDRVIVCPPAAKEEPHRLPDHYADGEFVAVKDLAAELGCRDLGEFMAALHQQRVTLYEGDDYALYVDGQVAEQIENAHEGLGVGGVDVCRPVDWMPPE